MTVCVDTEGQIVFFTPKGWALAAAPALSGLPVKFVPGPEGLVAGDADQRSADPAVRQLRRNRARGVTPDAWDSAPDYTRDRDIPWEIEARAWEALDPEDDGDSEAAA